MKEVKKFRQTKSSTFADVGLRVSTTVHADGTFEIDIYTKLISGWDHYDSVFGANTEEIRIATIRDNAQIEEFSNSGPAAVIPFKN